MPDRQVVAVDRQFGPYFSILASGKLMHFMRTLCSFLLLINLSLPSGTERLHARYWNHLRPTQAIY